MGDVPTTTTGAAHVNPVAEGGAAVSTVALRDRAILRFQTSPGAEGTVMRSKGAIPWELKVTVHIEGIIDSGTSFVMFRDTGTIAADSPIEINLDRGHIDFSWHNQVELTVWWEPDAETVYRLYLVRVEALTPEFSAENRIGSLGYYTGHLHELPRVDFIMEDAQKDQGFLNFQADNGLAPDGVMSAVLRAKVSEVTGDR